MDSAAETRTPTVTEREQWMVENDVFQIYNIFANVDQDVKSFMLQLRRERHLEYLDRGLRHLGPSFCVLDANRPWLCYWILHSIALLGESVDQELESNTIDFLSRCQDPDGGYGGGPGQMPHLATTYAAVNSLITVGGHGALSSINRDTLYTFLLRMKQPNGGFSMHDGGEVDVRACYTAISVASILNILDDELVQNVGSYTLSCQTYEGGIGGEPGSEAHGGYTFCGLATMILINEVNRLNLTRLIDWLVFRQGREGGFQGRTNKLVDGCYSFWQGGDFVLLRRLGSLIEDQLLIQNIGEDHSPHASTASARVEGTSVGGGPNTSSSLNYNNIGYNFIYKHPEMELLFNNILLQQYILLCSQSLQADEGGLRDKPRKSRDHYHTCYCLSGLSVSQRCRSNSEESLPLPVDVLGPYTNLLEPVHPLFNVILKQYFEAHEFFSTSTP